ncbi:hypothetical protein [Bacillus sp. FSL K6-3431]|uniref:hypothetical protein n=1 Tax=Bacillus sp. FSL K6-3431 TaxID=2921500 RepID=UPI0030FA4C9B
MTTEVRTRQLDWLVQPTKSHPSVSQSSDHRDVIMSNGLISRMWRLEPNAATVSYDNLMTGESIIRGVNPEALLVINGKRYEVGGLIWQGEQAYFKQDWLESIKTNPQSFQYTKYTVADLKERFSWKRKRYSAGINWPPRGVSLTFNYEAPANSNLEGISVDICYEMYDGIPLLSKSLTVYNHSEKEVVLDHFTSEILSVVEAESPVDDQIRWAHPNIHIESDYSFHGMTASAANETTHWLPDSNYTTQVNFNCNTIARIESKPKLGPAAAIAQGESFETFRTFELIYDSTERERKALSQKRMYRIVAPWVTENPIFMHVLSDGTDKVKEAIDQSAEVGFEMVILSFGSGFDIENENEDYLARMKELADYAHSKGIELGGYSLLASRTISKEDDVINAQGVTFNQSPCIGSQWGMRYFKKLMTFFEKTGFDVLEHDGSYPGDVCESTNHPGHQSKEDSQWTQWKTISTFYKWCREKGVYLNVPDWYFLNGSNKAGMGYREVNWALPRERHNLLVRQNIYDGTWEKTPSMGWMFVPIMEYHGGGPASTMEPLSLHLDSYEQHLITNFTSGVQAIYRGFRLYDTEETKQVVKNWVEFYKKHRAILDSDIIHVRRPDGKKIDCILHVNPELDIKGLAVINNPLEEATEDYIRLPLYYTGLTDKAVVRDRKGAEAVYTLDRGYYIEIPVMLEAGATTWFFIT